MSTVFSVVFVLVVLNACQQPAGENTTQDDFNEVTFACERGKSIVVRFSLNSELAMLFDNNQVAELTQKPSASGYFYTNNKISIRGKGDALQLEIGRMAALKCHAQ
ncbi:MliC family protein [Paraglaciecola aquimarina]|uniref:MliC family protein n=1 Tax=Paraglaciecola aquimarina TaxID=1235557 RepID=A0ABU3SWW3_9ALTE|nr:MliC family protein [Paraglaciecola aquimarina]MDU0354485.1 MliC family protein [Paraglaciecola aquimarina]